MNSKHLVPALCFSLILLSQGCSSKHPQATNFQNIEKGICHDTGSGLMWQNEKSQTIKTLEEAQRYVKNLNIGGYTDWRLPTVYELYDLNYIFDIHLNGECVLDRKGRYWSGEKDGEGKAGSWEISDQCDPARRYFSGTDGYVRAVRP